MTDPKALIESGDYPLQNTKDAVVGAQVKTITPYTEQTVKDRARKQALEAMPFGKKGLPELMADLGKTVLSGIADIFRALATGATFVVKTGLEFIGSLLNRVFDAVGSLIKPMQKEIKTGLSGQLALNDRIDLLDGAPGYVCAYQTVNLNSAWQANTARTLPFKGQVGPAKNAHLDTENGMIVLDAKGLWTFNARCHIGKTIYTGWGYCDVNLLVYTPEGQLYHEVAATFETPQQYAQSLVLATEPVVVDRPGYKAKIQIYMANWRTCYGGTRYSSFSAIRHSHEVENLGEQTVRDEV